MSVAFRGTVQLRLALVLLLLCGITCAHAQQPLRIAAAADLQPVLPPLLIEFQHDTGIEVQASYKSSATLATEIVSGAPFDLFLAADLSFPQRVIEAGRAVESSPVPYARGTLVLWARNDSGLAQLAPDALASSAIHSIAIANPEHAPYGRAAQTLLQRLRLYDAIRPKLVIAENIGQAAEYADSGNAQAGFISLTAALTPRLTADGHFVRMPDGDYPPILQGAVVIRNSGHTAAAQKFLDFLLSAATRKYLAAHGLEPVR